MAGEGKRSETNSIKPVNKYQEEENKRIAAMLTLLTDEQNLTSWEIDFVSDISSKFEGGFKLTQRQFDKLEMIYRKFN
jgi:hypothetical protein